MTQIHRSNRGGRIDRSRELSFTFNGKRYTGYAGDTLASALLANGVDIVNRSFKYSRPRGIVAAAIASITAATLETQGIAGGAALRALVFSTIAGAVVLSGALAYFYYAWLDKAVSVLLTAQRPVIVAGGGVQWSNAGDEVTRMADLIGAAITTSYGRADAVPNDHPLYLGHLGRLGSEEAIESAKQADVILAIGTRLGQSTAFYDNRYIPADAKIIQIEIDPEELGRNYPVSVGIEGDAKAVMEGLIAQVQQAEPRPNQQWVDDIGDLAARRKRRLDAEATDNAMPMKPQRVYGELRRVMPRDAIIALDAGLAPNFGQDRLNYYEPRSLMTSLDLGGLGFSFPAALGAKFAAPDRPVVNFNGDGGFLFNAQEFATAVRYRLKVVTVIMNNNCWGSEKAYQRYAFNERYVGADTNNPRYDKFAEIFGGTGFYVERPEDIGNAFLEALNTDGPSIIEIPTDPDEMPRPARLSDVQAPKT